MAMLCWQDVRYAARCLRRAPGFTVTAVVTLAVGIGVTTGVFSLADAMLWKPVALNGIESLYMALEREPGDPLDWRDLSPADFDDWRRTTGAFASLSGWLEGAANLVGRSGEPERVIQALVSSDFFDTLAQRPALGRGFLPGEDQPGRHRVAILSHTLWRRSFAADPSIVGTTIHLDDETYEVVGVMPAAFDFPLTTEIWTPMALRPEQRALRGRGMVNGIGRLKPTATPAMAAAEADSISRRLEREHPDTNTGHRFFTQPVRAFLTGGYARLYVLMVLWAALLVFAIACVNVANLQLARAGGRLREIAVRAALGAGRLRIVRQLLTETLLVALMGGAGAVFLAYWGLDAMRGTIPPQARKYIVGWESITLDAHTLAVALVAAILAGVTAGLLPALRISGGDLGTVMREGGRGTSAGRSGHRLRSLLVGAQVALAVVLLVGASLMIRGFRTVAGRDAARHPDTLLTLRLAITANKYREPHQVAAFYTGVLGELNALPGVRSAAIASALPHTRHGSGRGLEIEGRPITRGEPMRCQYQAVDPGYFATLRIPLLTGRLLSASDGADSPRVAVISRQTVHRYFASERDALGRRLRLTADTTSPWFTVVGVVDDIQHAVFERTFRPVVYVPYVQSPGTWMDVAVRAAAAPRSLIPAATAAIRRVDPEQPVTAVYTLSEALAAEAFGLTFVARLMGLFGVLALALCTVGIYGVMAYSVGERTREIGIRMALGAGPAGVLALVFRRGLLTTAAGIAAGVALAVGFARMLATLVYGITALDPITFLSIPLTLAVVALAAVWIPARRAVRIDPMVALRCDG